MKRMMAMCLALMLLAGFGALAEDAPLLDGGVCGNGLGLRLLAEGFDGQSNRLISPVSLAYALSMAACGAAGDTQSELLAALNAESGRAVTEWNEALAESGLRWANAAFLRDDLEVKQGFIDDLETAFEAERFPLDDVDAVNAWVDARTDHLIDRLIDGLDPETRLVLTNAIAMDAEWVHTFDPESTVEAAFYAPGGEVQAEYLKDTFTLDYGEGELGQFARLDYRDSGLYMLVMLPEGDLSEALSALAKDPGLVPGLKPTEVALRLPKLDVSASNALSEALQAMGVDTAFTTEADLTPISDEPLMIDEVLQKVRLQVDEEGTRAAAATAVVIMAKGALMEEPVRMDVNRPYALFIVDRRTGAICFAAAISDPTA